MEYEISEIVSAVNTIWVLVAGFLVFFMQLGFGMLEAGLVRVKNVANILLHNILDFSIASLGYWALGFALMFGGGNLFFGTSFFFLRGIPETSYGIPTQAFWFFQLCFAGAAATIVAGGMAERTKFVAYLAYSVVISTLIYPLVGHWIWGGGFLGELGFLDFAGSTVVHSVGGWAALVGTIILGPRIGKFGPDGKANVIVGHSLALANLGMWVLWFGWFGFNPGSTLSGMQSGLIAKVAVNTNAAAATGAVMAMFFSWAVTHKPDAGLTMNGALAGLVAITAPCAYVSLASSVIIGAVGGIVVVLGVLLLDRVRVDDPVGAVPVHCFNGIWGTLAVGLFHESTGLFSGGGVSQLGIQALGVLLIALWIIVTTTLLFLVIKYTIGLRVSREEELAGLDLGEHGVSSYPEFEIVSADSD
jgi:Amt family ammonium transporter